MFRESLTAAIHRQPAYRYAGWMALLLTLIFVTSMLSADLRFAGERTAPWWPAAGISVVAVFAARGRGFVVAGLIVIVTATANFAAGTSWWLSIGFGVANAVEAWLVVAITHYGRHPGRRFRSADCVRFIVATVAGAVVVGILVGAVVALDGGDLIGTATHVAASHGSAVMLIGMFGLVARSSFIPNHPFELLLQVLLLSAAVLVIILGSNLPLGFVVFPVLALATFRFTAGVTLIEATLVSVAVTVASFLGLGVFATSAAGDADLLIGLIQLFTLSLGVSLLPLAVGQDDRTDLYLRLSAREQLLRGAIVSANAGFIVARRIGEGVYRVVESNPTGDRMLASWLTRHDDTTTVDRDRMEALTSATPAGTTTGVEFPGGVYLDLTATPVAGDRSLVLIQAIDITEQRRAAQALADAFVNERESADRLRALATQKDEFVSSVSHELRTPVTSILGYAEELADADLPAGDRQSVDVIMRNARRLAALVEDLLGVSRDANTAPVAPTAIEVRAAISECAEELFAIALRAQVDLKVVAGDEYVIAGDRLQLDRILVNLLANAIKFTPPHGRVGVTVAGGKDGYATIEVTDTGRGIPPSELEKVFERFHRVTEKDEFVPGTGLGLPIVRDLVTRMGGRIELRSDGKSGTTAVVELPLFADA